VTTHEEVPIVTEGRLPTNEQIDAYRGAEEMRSPNLYRLTYVQSCDADPRNKRAVRGTHEYLRIKTPDEAGAKASAREDADERNIDRAKSSVTTSSFSEHRVH
jgi:hypothetical protein